MMTIKRVTPDEAARLAAEGWIYVDVRSVPEFDAGHPAGAYNVPYLHDSPSGMVPNPDFARVMAATFPKDARLLLGCRSGNRSLRAAGELAEAGYDNIMDVRGGYLGETDALGDVVCEGWVARGLPTATAAEPGKSWTALKGE